MRYNNHKKNGFGRIGLILGLPFIIIVLGFVIYKVFFIAEPVVKGIEALELLSADKTVTLHGQNIKEIKINVYQNGNAVELLNDAPEYVEKTYTLQIKPGELKLSDGPAVISIEAKAGLFKKASYELRSNIDSEPPSLSVLRATAVIQHGSSGFAVLRSKGADSVYIKFGDLTFPAFKVDSENSGAQPEEVADKSDTPSGSITDTYYVFFPAPFDIEEENTFYAVASDTAGNQRVRSLPTRLKLKDYKVSSITIDDTFINTVIASLLNETEITDPVAAFRKVNEDWRKESSRKIIEIAKTTEPALMWEGRFLQMRNSKVMATYGDKREYIYDGQVVSKSAHLGYDLASHAHAPVEAANTGIVSYANFLSIYGNTVIIDHGLGLMTIYGHLSEISVSEGEAVKKGDIIGKTGASGLAGGDHLHFGVLVHGYEVSPLYWWDPKWVNVNIIDSLSD